MSFFFLDKLGGIPCGHFYLHPIFIFHTFGSLPFQEGRYRALRVRYGIVPAVFFSGTYPRFFQCAPPSAASLAVASSSVAWVAFFWPTIFQSVSCGSPALKPMPFLPYETRTSTRSLCVFWGVCSGVSLHRALGRKRPLYPKLSPANVRKPTTFYGGTLLSGPVVTHTPKLQSNLGANHRRTDGLSRPTLCICLPP